MKSERSFCGFLVLALSGFFEKSYLFLSPSGENTITEINKDSCCTIWYVKFS
jgi:hypothetical protein